VHRRGDGLADDRHGDLDDDLLALPHEEEVDVLDLAAHGLDLHVTDDRELDVALDVDLEERVLVTDEREVRLVRRERHVERVRAVPVEDGGHATLAAGTARRTLAEVGAEDGGELDVRHGGSCGVRETGNGSGTRWAVP